MVSSIVAGCGGLGFLIKREAPHSANDRLTHAGCLYMGVFINQTKIHGPVFIFQPQTLLKEKKGKEKVSLNVFRKRTFYG